MGDVEPGRTRRSFLDLVFRGGIAGLLAAVVYPVLRYLSPPAAAEPGARSVVLNPEDPKQVDPNTRLFVFGDKPGILVKGPGGEWKAFSAICTHLGCTVRYKTETRTIWCPCHNGMFDLNGRNLPGTPPPRPLDELRVQPRPDGTLVVRR